MPAKPWADREKPLPPYVSAYLQVQHTWARMIERKPTTARVTAEGVYLDDTGPWTREEVEYMTNDLQGCIDHARANWK